MGVFLLRFLNFGYDISSLSLSQRHGVITLIPKKDKPRDYLRNWRPISLLNISYKVASSSIANRMKKVLNKIISPDQNGFMKGRYIGDCIRTIYDTMLSLNKDNLPGVLFCIDFEKAVDSVSLNFVFKTLKFFFILVAQL